MRVGVCTQIAIVLMVIAHGSISRAAVEQAISAGDFDNSVGVNTHFAYSLDPNSVWHNSTTWTTLAINLGVTHIRDGLIPSYALDPANANSNYVNSFRTLAQNGIGVDLITDPTQTYGNLDPIQSAVNSIIALNANQPGTVEAVEGPNEIDGRSWTYNGVTYSPATPATDPAITGSTSFAAGIVKYQGDLYAAMKGNSNTSKLTVIGPSEGGTYSFPYGNSSNTSQPLPNGSLYSSSDWGNFHPYTFGGNYETQHFAYDGIANVSTNGLNSWYYGDSQSPGVNISPASTTGSGAAPFSFANYQQPFQQFSGSTVTASLPMVATEKGYFTGTAAESVSQSTFAKYIPRIFADDMLFGIKRTYSYELADEGTDLTNQEDNYGLVHSDGTPKPAYYTLQHMLSILKDTGTNSHPASLNYSLSVSIPMAYQTANPNYWGIPDTVQHLLLQRSDGTFELVLWNDVSSSSLTDVNGNKLTSTARDISVPNFPTTITFGTSIKGITLYGLNPYGTTAATTLDTTAETLTNNQLTVNVPDYVEILEFSATPEPSSVTALMFAGALLMRRNRRKITARKSHG